MLSFFTNLSLSLNHASDMYNTETSEVYEGVLNPSPLSSPSSPPSLPLPSSSSPSIPVTSSANVFPHSTTSSQAITPIPALYLSPATPPPMSPTPLSSSLPVLPHTYPLPFSVPGASYRSLLPPLPPLPPPPSRPGPSPLSFPSYPIINKVEARSHRERIRKLEQVDVDTKDEVWRGLCWGLWFPGCMMLVVYTRCKHNLPVSYGASVGSTISTALLTLILLLAAIVLSRHNSCSRSSTCVSMATTGSAPMEWNSFLIACNKSIANGDFSFIGGSEVPHDAYCPISPENEELLVPQSPLCATCICYNRMQRCSSARSLSGALWVVTGIVGFLFVMSVLMCRKYRARLQKISLHELHD